MDIREGEDMVGANGTNGLDQETSGGTSDDYSSETNVRFLGLFWYLTAGVLAVMVVFRAINLYQSQSRLRRRAAQSVPFPTRPSNRLFAVWATVTTVIREASYPQLYVPVRFATWLTPPPLGRVLVLVLYWAVVIYMMISGAVVDDENYWERIGFRNAWVTIAQVPLLYMLASKCNLLGLITGVGYERFSWLHRWVARTVLVTASVHGWFFWREWVLTDTVADELQGMRMVRYGIAAWALLLWSLLSGLGPFRKMAYELFVVQHIMTAVFFLGMLFLHVPYSASWLVWWALAAMCADRLCRAVLLVWRNVRLSGSRKMGHQASVRAMGESITVITIKDVRFRWQAGQHVYLRMPGLSPLEAHPYTIVSLPNPSGTCSSMQLVVRKHAGFSRRLHAVAVRNQAPTDMGLTVLLSGPYGVPPRWDTYETVVLMAASTGASFTLPILESVLLAGSATCTSRVDFLLMARQGDELEFYLSRLHDLVTRADAAGIQLLVHVAVTRDPSAPTTVTHEGGIPMSPSCWSDRSYRSNGSETRDVDMEKMGTQERPGTTGSCSGSRIQHSNVRPDLAAFLRAPVEATGGETLVVVCGGPSLVAHTRNCVTRLSNERGVHKGSGAQGIALHVEEYCF